MTLAKSLRASETGAVRVNIINRNYPPHAGVTGESAAELAEYLTKAGLAVNVLYVDAEYRKGGPALAAIGSIFTVRTFYNGKNKLLRLFSNIYESVRLLRLSKRLNPDVTICMTEPPLLSVCAAVMLPRKHPWILWSMDLYPEALAASHLVSTKNPVYRVLDRIVRTRSPHHVIGLGAYQIAFLAQKFDDRVGFTSLPCGIYADDFERDPQRAPEWSKVDSRLILGYCGNIGEAHSVEFLASVVDNLDAAQHRLILAVYGSRARAVLDYAVGKPGVEIVDFVRRDELKYIDIHLASLKAEWINVCVPSKTVSSVCSGSAFLYHGEPESDNWGLLKDAGWILTKDGGDLGDRIRKWLDESPDSLQTRRKAARRLANQLIEMKRSAMASILSTVLALASGQAPHGLAAGGAASPGE